MINKIRVNVYLDSELKSKAMDLARKMGLNFSSLVNLALYDFIKHDSVIKKEEQEPKDLNQDL